MNINLKDSPENIIKLILQNQSPLHFLSQQSIQALRTINFSAKWQAIGETDPIKKQQMKVIAETAQREIDLKQKQEEIRQEKQLKEFIQSLSLSSIVSSFFSKVITKVTGSKNQQMNNQNKLKSI